LMWGGARATFSVVSNFQISFVDRRDSLVSR
jgi:hypothetical protein